MLEIILIHSMYGAVKASNSSRDAQITRASPSPDWLAAAKFDTIG
jgi:hypothetical protein